MTTGKKHEEDDAALRQQVAGGGVSGHRKWGGLTVPTMKMVNEGQVGKSFTCCARELGHFSAENGYRAGFDQSMLAGGLP